jgi:hypothetical protein
MLFFIDVPYCSQVAPLKRNKNDDHVQDYWVFWGTREVSKKVPECLCLGLDLGHLGVFVIAFLRPKAVERR